ncbi:hypothetical protein EDB83DRAFT_2678375 [Lactarius deliciosus]|nr:hypothetical protein EDB83DRAFT_2678375 [Lactarius deliciosus]
MSRYYDDDEDDDPYTPRIGPAAMPSPRSKYAPYYSGHANTFEDFLEEFEGRAYDCALTDPQRVDVIIRYVAPSLRDFWRSLNGYCSRDWPLFRQSLITVFGSTTPRPQVMRQRLLSYVQDSSRTRMGREDDVLQYYRQFLCYSLPLVHAGHLTEDDRNAAFWYGFHPEDREILWPRLFGKNPLQPPDVPFRFEDVFRCARAAFAYDNYFPSPWSQKLKFEPSSVRLTRTVATYTETTPDELSPSSHSTSDTQPPSSSSHSASESQHTQAPSVTLDQPEPAYTLSTTLPPSTSFSTLSHASSLARSTVDNDPIPASTPPPFSLIPSAFPTSTHTDSLARSDAEISSIHPLSSIMLASTMPSISSNFDYLSSATVDQPTPTLLSTPPSSSSISPTFVPSATEDQSEPEPSPALFASIPTMSSTPSHVHSAINNFASTPPSSSSTSSTCLPSVTEEQPEPETESIPSITPSSTFAPTPPSSSTFLPSPVSMRSAMNSQPKIESALVSESAIPPSIDHIPEIASAPDQTLAPLSSSTLSSSPLQEISSLGSGSLLVAPSPDQPSSLLESLSQLSRPCELESSTLVSAADVVTLSHPELPLSSPGEPVPFLPASSETPPNAPISPHSTPPQRRPELKTIGSVSTPLEVYEVSSIKPPALAPRLSLFHSSPSPRLSGTSIHFGFAFALVTAAVLVSTLINVSAALLTHTREFRSKRDISDIRIDTLKASSCDPFTYRLRLGQLTPRAPRLVFDPGGSVIAPDLGTRRRSQTQVEDIISSPSPRSTPASFIPVSTLDDLIVFDSGGGAFC